MHLRLRAPAHIALLSMTILVAGASAAGAFVLSDPALDKAAIAHRKDIFAQSTKLHACLIKASLACEKGQAAATRQCYLRGVITPPTTMFTGNDPKMTGIADKFEAAVQKCLAGIDFAKKGARGLSPDERFTALGCPGDCRGTGHPSCTGLADFQGWFAQTTLGQASNLAGLPGASVRIDDTDTGGCVPRSSADPKIGAQQEKDFARCIDGVFARVVKYDAALQKCQAACESDYTGKKGGGGPVDGPPTCNTGATLDPADPFALCVAKATAKLTETPLPVVMALQLPGLHQQLDFRVNSLFNAPDGCVAPPS